MTPLINALMKRAGQIAPIWRADLTMFDSFAAFAGRIAQARAFLISDAEGDTTALYDLYPTYTATCSGVFLPANPCWIEFNMQAPGKAVAGRRAFLATYVEGHIGVIDVVASDDPKSGMLQIIPAFLIDPRCIGTDWDMEKGGVAARFTAQYKGLIESRPETKMQPRFFIECLQLINLPHSLKRTATPPHKATERRLREIVRQAPPLRPWEAIKLDPFTAAQAVGGGAPGAAQRAYHFCRAHERLKRGKREHVRAHWRGNPEHGVSSRKLYMVRPGERDAGATVH